MFEWLSDRIAQAQVVFQEFSLDWTHRFNPPATEEEITACENALGAKLPPSYREFLLLYDGVHLFCEGSPYNLEYDNPRLIIYGTANLAQENYDEKEYRFTDEEWTLLIKFCYVGSLGSGDFCALDPQQITNSEYAVLDCMHELKPTDWRQTKIADSFEEWLQKVFDHVVVQKKSPEYWLEAESSLSFSLAEHTCDSLITRGERKAQIEDYQGAIADFNSVIQLDPTDTRGYYNRGNIYFTLKDYQQAIADYTTAIELDSEHLAAYDKRGLAQIELKDYQGAIANYTQVIEVNDRVNEYRNTNFYQYRGDVYSLLADSQKAEADYRKAAALRDSRRSGDFMSENDDYDLYDDDSEDEESWVILSTNWEQTDEE
jgi:tetratricopeptide (TPR) repeat protein